MADLRSALLRLSSRTRSRGLREPAVRDLLFGFLYETTILRLHSCKSLAESLHRVTNNLERRLAQHRAADSPGFTKRYRIFRLVHYELFGDIRFAIAREKESNHGDVKRKSG